MTYFCHKVVYHIPFYNFSTTFSHIYSIFYALIVSEFMLQRKDISDAINTLTEKEYEINYVRELLIFNKKCSLSFYIFNIPCTFYIFHLQRD